MYFFAISEVKFKKPFIKWASESSLDLKPSAQASGHMLIISCVDIGCWFLSQILKRTPHGSLHVSQCLSLSSLTALSDYLPGFS